MPETNRQRAIRRLVAAMACASVVGWGIAEYIDLREKAEGRRNIWACGTFNDVSNAALAGEQPGLHVFIPIDPAWAPVQCENGPLWLRKDY